MNTHSDNIKDLVIEYVKKAGGNVKKFNQGFEVDELDDELESWLNRKTELSIKGIEYE